MFDKIFGCVFILCRVAQLSISTLATSNRRRHTKKKRSFHMLLRQWLIHLLLYMAKSSVNSRAIFVHHTKSSLYLIWTKVWCMVLLSYAIYCVDWRLRVSVCVRTVQLPYILIYNMIRGVCIVFVIMVNIKLSYIRYGRV